MDVASKASPMDVDESGEEAQQGDAQVRLVPPARGTTAAQGEEHQWVRTGVLDTLSVPPSCILPCHVTLVARSRVEYTCISGGGWGCGPRPVPTVSVAQLVLALCRFLSSFFDCTVYDIFAMLLHFH